MLAYSSLYRESFSREHSNAIWRQTLDSVTATSAGSTGEIAAVLEAVAQYPFRTDAAKVVILITDTTSQVRLTLPLYSGNPQL